MEELSFLTKTLSELGTTGLVLVVAWRLLDKWGGALVSAQNKQAVAMTDLASAVQNSQGEQREVLIAMRVLATKVDETKAWVKELNGLIRDERRGSVAEGAEDDS